MISAGGSKTTWDFYFTRIPLFLEILPSCKVQLQPWFKHNWTKLINGMFQKRSEVGTLKLKCPTFNTSKLTCSQSITHRIKGVIGCKIHFTSCLNIMCVGSVCTHPSYNDKNPPSGFLKIPIFKIPFLKSGCSEIDTWVTRLSYLRPAPEWAERAVRHCVDSGAGKTCLRLSDYEVFCFWSNNEYSSRHLLLTSEPLKDTED